ncbi:putative sulfate/molybdate transporter [Massilia sp. YIM B02769]|uniref:putative sulfate/molybdate transporter n=1 Tax=Massilia sp. YIM B02769 TaxID=3050129 RepID=UPI0025B68A1B|nr:putative sulfate/molybdate transporter [Massilia sp. YIM B02769]MDN4060007.1 putative sulfate/molybdate transporter [Massilia sp. YIM B02769]
MHEELPQIPTGARTEPAPLRFDRAEWAAAFADLGIFIPYVVAYVSVMKMDPVGILLAFGLALVACGFVYRTPLPVQPMKAIGAVAVAQAATLSANAVVAASVVSGALWLVLGLSGAASRLARAIPREAVLGVMLGLGISFMLQGLRMMGSDWLAAVAALILALVLRNSRPFPAMLVLLAGGLAYGVARQPALWDAAAFGFALRLPSPALGQLQWPDFVTGTLLLALPQLPLTLGNAVIGTTEENNRLFPDRETSVRKVAVSTGVMNLAGGAIGGVPMCHGAGGMAAYAAFGARSGGAPIIFGATLVVLALCFSGAIVFLLQAVPAAVLGAILFLTGVRLASGNAPRTRDWRVLLPVALTAMAALWNVGLGLVVGVVASWMCRRSRTAS